MKKVDLIANKWVEITDKSCSFQNRSGFDVFIFEGDETPESLDECFIVRNLDILNFNGDKKLFAFSSGANGKIIISE